MYRSRLLGNAEHRLLGAGFSGGLGGRTNILVTRLHEPFPDVRRLRHGEKTTRTTIWPVRPETV